MAPHVANPDPHCTYHQEFIMYVTDRTGEQMILIACNCAEVLSPILFIFSLGQSAIFGELK